MKRNESAREEDSDVDHYDVLDRILDKLYDFGDGHKRLNRKHKKNRLKQEVEEEDEVMVQNGAEKPDCRDGDAYVSHVTDAPCHHQSSASTSLAARNPGGKVQDVEIVTFQDPLKKNRLKRTLEPEHRADEGKEKKKKEADVLSMEKARLDVHRFGITGFQKQQQRVFEQDRAIMLGARPPKKEYVNYKVYQQTLKMKKSKEKEDEEKSDTLKKKKRSSGKLKNVKRKSGGADPGGHVGRFKNGMLLLSTKEIQKLNSKKRK
ncbi:uncharacterized protein C1orf131 homolog [Silurus meridionalis]|uniref:Uncharacterized protein n=1 Tax=Silurus meridionalis TaxID=175797 RepID=A0A8T0AR26_SILME|nr:uncharacterized protein C1orf131 homolog [Silurus meridionalis]XP_046729739.1 uncharacterized protein C1orf131 homolog [Silurus meridionalis]KAF7694467.1 hypothetical protein HF521_008220 [Silurus meridionalis]